MSRMNAVDLGVREVVLQVAHGELPGRVRAPK